MEFLRTAISLFFFMALGGPLRVRSTCLSTAGAVLGSARHFLGRLISWKTNRKLYKHVDM